MIILLLSYISDNIFCVFFHLSQKIGYKIKVDFGIIFYLLHFFGTLHLDGKSVDHGKTSSSSFFIEWFSHVQLDALVFVEKQTHQEAPYFYYHCFSVTNNGFKLFWYERYDSTSK